MEVTVLFFGATADSVGERKVSLEIPEGTDAKSARQTILEAYPSLSDNHDPDSLHFSINQAYANGAEIIKNGDELAVFTPVSGG